MAIAFTRAKAISRSNGQNVVACSAYRTGQQLFDHSENKNHDYHKRKGIIEIGITVPDNAPRWMTNRSELWNRVEAQENRKDSQLAKEFIVAIPHEIVNKSIPLTKVLAEQLAKKGMVVDWAIHAPSKEGDERNYHIHFLTTMRKIEGEKFGEKARNWNKPEFLAEIKAGFAKIFNRELEAKGIKPIDWRSYEQQGITDRLPQQHLGVEATAIERRGEKTYKKRYRDVPKIEKNEVSLPVENLVELENKIKNIENISYFANLNDDQWKIIETKAKKIEEQVIGKCNLEAIKEFIAHKIPEYKRVIEKETKEYKTIKTFEPDIEKRTLFNGKKIDEQEEKYKEWEEKKAKQEKRIKGFSLTLKNLQKIDTENLEQIREFADKEDKSNHNFKSWVKDYSKVLLDTSPKHQEFREQKTALELVKKVRDNDRIQTRNDNRINRDSGFER